MNADEEKITSYFSKLGFDSDITRLYLALDSHGPQSISSLARLSEVERTRIYRLLPELKSVGLVEEQVLYKKHLYHAAPLSNLHGYLAQKQDALHDLKKGLNELELTRPAKQISHETTQVRFYEGADGVRQMQWNLFKASSEIYAIMDRPMMEVTGNKFFERWAHRWNELPHLSSKLIFNENFLKQSNDWHNQNQGHRVYRHTSRVIASSEYLITHCIDIYDSTVAFYNWTGDDIYGIEIVNAEIAKTHNYFFTQLWNQGGESGLLNKGEYEHAD